MEPQGDYSKFLKMNKDKQIEYVQGAVHREATPVEALIQYPDLDFIKLSATQDKKQIMLATFRYPAQPSTKAVVIFLHSLGGHGGIAANYAKKFSAQGITLVGFDQRGHGRSEGERGYLDNSKQMLKDAKNFVSEVRKMYPNEPLFLMGQNLGSLFAFIIAKELKETKFAGLILASPSMKKPSHNKLIAAVSDFALKLMPNKAGIFEFNYENACGNPNAAELMKKDPLNYHGKVYAGTLGQLLGLMDIIPEKSWDKATVLPTVIIQGELDKVVDPASTISLFQKLSIQDKTIWWYPKMWNNFFLEPEAAEIADRIVKWIEKHA